MSKTSRIHLAVIVLALAASGFAASTSEASAAQMCAGHRATIVGTTGPDNIVGTRASDVIVGLGGNDVINDGSNGNDIICGGPGDDTIIGAGGNDLIEGGAGADTARGGGGNDRIWGGPGPDSLFAENGDDLIHGDAGDDLVNGGLGDDIPIYAGGLYGDGGTDHVYGGTGVDLVDGGPGDGDVVSGDQGPDDIVGGPGRDDIASFSTASVVSNLGWKSPGCQHTAGYALVVDMSQNVACEFLAPDKIVVQKMSGIEDVVGTAFPDRIDGDSAPNRIDGGPGDDQLAGGPGFDQAFGGSGTNVCTTFEEESSCAATGAGVSGGVADVEVNRSIDGTSTLSVLASPANNDINVSYQAGQYSITDTAGISAGSDTGCTGSGTNVECQSDSLSSLLVEGGPGDDQVTIANSVPASVDVTVDGGAGDDRIIGGSGADHLNGGPSGNDVAYGRGGGDVLYGGGNDPDQMYGGPGLDLITMPATCGGGSLIDGGRGGDNVSYALSDQSSVWVMSLKTGTAGFALPNCGTDKLAGISSLEGTKGDDILIGDAGHNGLIGHGGADVFRAGRGKDYIDARDGAADKVVDCGAGRDMRLADSADSSVNCNP